MSAILVVLSALLVVVCAVIVGGVLWIVATPPDAFDPDWRDELASIQRGERVPNLTTNVAG